MSTGQTAVSKPLLILLVVAVILAIGYFAYTAMNNRTEQGPNVPKVPENLPPVSPEDMSKGPQPQGFNKR